MQKTATFSECRQYRYTLTRIWDESKPYCQFIGLNPSTADETQDDPTVRRCIQFAKDWGYGGLVMTNLFAFRATRPEVMIAHYSSVDVRSDIERNFDEVVRVAQSAGITVAAWGNGGGCLNASKNLFDRFVREELPIHALRLTKSGEPSHPLYLPNKLTPIQY